MTDEETPLKQMTDDNPKATASRVCEWKPIVEVLAIPCAFLISLLALVISYKANQLTATAVRQGQKSYELQEAEFQLRNRPYLTVASEQPTLIGPIRTAEGRVYEHALNIKILNLSDVPALNVSVSADVMVDNRVVNTEITSSNTTGSAIAIYRSNEFGFKISLLDQTYALLSDSNHTIQVKMIIKYFGMLKEKTPYTTKVRLDYWPPTHAFGLGQQEIE